MCKFLWWESIAKPVHVAIRGDVLNADGIQRGMQQIFFAWQVSRISYLGKLS